ncbi:hypothetical protein Ancab_018736 [Ancistrocladus abbreviatus]
MEMEIDPAKSEPQERQFRDDELFKAAESGDTSTFCSLSPEQVSKALCLRNEDGRSLIHVAASSCHPQAVKILAEADSSGIMINSKDEEGWAPLHSAASIGNVNIVETLLGKAANVNVKNDGGRTPLHYAASKGWLKIAELLLSHSAEVNAQDKVGCTPLHRAASTGHSEFCELLIEEGAEVDALDKAGQTPLMNAVICQHKDVALLLIRHGADVDIEDKEGYTVLGRASDDLRNILVDAAKAMLEG